MQSRSTFLSGSIRGNVTVGFRETTQTPRLISGYTRNTDVALTPAAKESTNDVPEVVSVKNLPENGALWCRNVTVESASHPGREDGVRCGGEPRQLTSSTTEKASSSGKKKRTFHTVPTATASPNLPARCPTTARIQLRLQLRLLSRLTLTLCSTPTRARARAYTHSALRVDVIRSHTSA